MIGRGQAFTKVYVITKKNLGNFALTKGHLRGKGAGAQVNRFFRTIRSNKPVEKKNGSPVLLRSM